MITIENLKRLADNVKEKFVSIKQGKENYGKILAVNEDGNTETMSAPESMDVSYNEEEKRLVVSSKTNLPGNVSVDPTLSVSGNAADAKAVGNAVNGVVKYNEAQELTDEERTQARANIDAQGFNWHQIGYYVDSELKDLYLANASEEQYNIVDWSTLLSLESTNTDSTGKAYLLAYYLPMYVINNIFNTSTLVSNDTLAGYIKNKCISDLNKLIENNLISANNNLYIWDMIYTSNTSYSNNFKRLKIEYKPETSLCSFLNGNTQHMVIYNNGTIVYNTVKPDYDTTLTYSGTAADAKAVGDKFNELTEKINEVEEGSSIPCKWEDIQDKPFGEEKVCDTIFENVELTSTYQFVTGSNTAYVNLNGPVQVIYNDVGYIFEEDSGDYGDRDLVNYPFYINCYKDGRWIVENENPGDIISLYATKTVINQLDEKFIPDVIARIPDWNVSATDSTNRIDNKPFGKVLEFVKKSADNAQTSSSGVYSISVYNSLYSPFKLVINDNEYVFDTLPFGDETFAEYPFYASYTTVTIAGGTTMLVYKIQTANAEDVIEFYSTEEVDKQLDEAYIPDTIARTEDIPTIPTQLSAFENDSEFITNTVDNLANYYLKSETYTQDEVKALVSAIPKFSIQVVDTLPTEDISTTTVYLVKSGEETDNLYTEYIYVNGAWEYLGKQTVDLSGYALAADVLKKDNTEEYTPTEDYHPATKKYVDESIEAIPSDVFVVNITGDGSGDLATSDKSYDEIMSAINTGKIVKSYFTGKIRLDNSFTDTDDNYISYTNDSPCMLTQTHANEQNLIMFEYSQSDSTSGYSISLVMYDDDSIEILASDNITTLRSVVESYLCNGDNAELTTTDKTIIGAIKELNSTKLSLPTDSEGNVLTGTAGQVLVSDGDGGFTWTTISTETAEDGNEVTY